MSLNLTVTSPVQSFTEPITLAEAQEYLRVPVMSPVDSDSDALINALITAAREVAETYQGRDLVEKQWDLTLEAFPVEIQLRDPLVTVDLIRYRDSDGDYTTLTANTDYIVDTAKHPGIVRPPYDGEWPSFTAWPTSPVLIRFTSGYAAADVFWSDAGKRVLIGMKMLISHWYNNRLPFFPQGGSSTMELPFTVTSLLSAGACPRVY